MRDVIIFDFDGTLADTLEAGREIFNRIAPDYGLATVEADRIAELRHLTTRGPVSYTHLTLPTIYSV